ncbi:cardiolipin synthase ClsB [Pseudomonas sp. 148P]|uniref:Cardiolipin synthase B n=1 Tax=Pseudomonas ulcerans TaxID=3115852 RepID=A0ABU7HTK3_9PSED|nr:MULTISPECIES: cardiolipin synthase ClsB [unclassified Pseudomonas]MEE1923260.1 cardiolipin synthase ClsB [Pseudomonas sp. 147P]MEE1934865.1 cardiolipin synthase ClsB [Pseudomonas sp. 148P]
MNTEWRAENEVQLLINGEGYYPPAFEAIRQAREEVLLETFIIYEDKVGLELQKALIEAARRGVRVQVLVDGYGTAELSHAYLQALFEAGVQLQAFDPSPMRLGVRTNLFRRLHRKILVIDGVIGFIGGINYCADHLGDFGPQAKQDYAVQVRGPIVDDLRRATLTLLDSHAQVGRRSRAWWRRAPVLDPDSDQARMRLFIRDNNEHPTDIEQQYLRAIVSAHERIVIANAYFFPGYRLLRALRNAARRGVEVTLILQGMPDMPWVRLCSRLLYNYLLRDGVQIHEYCERPLHGKVALVDREWTTVGSSNLDPLSLSLNLEANLVIRDAAFNQRLYEHLDELRKQRCKTVTLQRILRGYWWRAPLIFLTFHFTRYFPRLFGTLPAHKPRLKPLYRDADVIQERLS